MKSNMPTIILSEITRANLDAILDLSVSPTQSGFVASNAKSLAQAMFYQDVAWFRAIYCGDLLVGFLMVDRELGSSPFLWRFMIDENCQGKGYGKAALSALCAYLAEQGAQALVTSCVPGELGPQRFYERFGFVPTGEFEDAEMLLKLTL